MTIQDRKIRKIGNELSIDLSSEFVESIGAKVGDVVTVDESKLSEFIRPLNAQSVTDEKVEEIMKRISEERRQVFIDLVDR